MDSISEHVSVELIWLQYWMNIQRRVHPSDEQEQSMAAQIVHVITVGDIPFLLDHLRDDHKVDMHDGFTFNH